MVRITTRAGIFAVALFVFIGAQTAFANTIIDLKTGATNVSNTAKIGGTFIVGETNTQPTGTGYIDSFLRIQQDGSERGFNTNAKPVPLDDKSGNFTHSLLLSDIGTITVGGNVYYHFVLDINQNGTNLLSLNQVQIFRGSSDPASYTLTEAAAGSASLISLAGDTEVFRMNNTGDSNAFEIQMDYSINSGSGSGDIDFLVSKSYIDSHGSGNYITLYSQFGSPNGAYSSNDGFEEWWNIRSTPCTDFTTCNPQSEMPEPSSVLLLGSGLVGLALAARKRSSKK